MFQEDLSLSSVTPAASLLARCVSTEVLSEVEIGSASSRISPAFSHLQETEQRIRTKRQLAQLQIELDLLRMEEQSADVTDSLHLTRRLQVVQMTCDHLQDVLKDHSGLRRRLMKPLGQTNLPIQAQLHWAVVDLLKLLLDLIKTLDEKMDSVRYSPAARECLDQLNACLTQLLANVSGVETLSHRVLQMKVHSSST